jgi:hypothetical protein
MSVQETSEIRELTADEINDVSGGAFWEAAGGPMLVAGMAPCGLWIAVCFLNSETGTLKHLL